MCGKHLQVWHHWIFLRRPRTSDDLFPTLTNQTTSTVIMSHDKTETSTYRNTSSSTETDTAMSSFFGVSVGETLFNCSPFWQVIRMQQCLFDATFACRVIHVLKLLLHQLQVMVSLPRPKLDAKRYKLGFHLCSNSIWILRPEMNPGHLSHP